MKKKILVVDNHPVILKYMTNLLEKHGHQVKTAGDGLSALDILRTYTPHVMFVDLVMPNIDGEQLCRIIREMPALKDTYTVILSATIAEKSWDFNELGADAFIVKGRFDEMGKHVLAAIEQSDRTVSTDAPEIIMGSKGVYKREITRELIWAKGHLEMILGNISDGVIELAPDGRIIFANPAAVSFMGTPEGALLGGTFVESIHVRDRQRIEKLLLRIDGGSERVTLETPLLMNSRHISLSMLRVKENDTPSIMVVLNDITEIIQAEDVLKKEHQALECQRLTQIFDFLPDATMVIDLEGRVIAWNQAIEHMTGIKARDMLGKGDYEYAIPFYGERRPVLIDLVGQRNTEIEAKYRYVKKIGESLVSETYDPLVNRGGFLWNKASLLYDSAGEIMGTIESIRDITEIKKLEAQLQQAQKMEAMGTLAGGIAHDFNNLLMAIQGRVSIALMDKDSSHSDFEHLKGIEGHVESAVTLTRQLLGFARGGKYEVKPTNINDLIEKSSQMFGRTKKEITIHKKYHDQIWTVEVDQNQIDQVLLNIFVNAWQAMPAGGHLYIQTKNETLDKNVAGVYGVRLGKYVAILITDTGIGMDEKTLKRVFDPFFTSKDKEMGTGLGLASAYGIIQNHDGVIMAESTRGQGATFHIYLPATENPVIDEIQAGQNILVGTETILLVDDENMIIDVGAEILQKLGYEVLTARHGMEAIEVYQQNRQKIAMVILDLIMPQMGGGETYDRLKEVDPQVKVLLSSGYSLDGQATEILNRGCDGFIQKPFSMEDLSVKLRHIIVQQ